MNKSKKMKAVSVFILFTLMSVIACSISRNKMDKQAEYTVQKLKNQIIIDGNWGKDAWKKIKEIPINNYMGEIPAFRPVAKAKMTYDNDNLYLIFRVEDKHVRIQTQNFNDPVSGDACVEFFFSPDSNYPLRYFNLEINAGGTALIAYHKDGKRQNFTEKDFEKAQIAHSLPKVLDGEISQPVTWTIECKLPLNILKKFSNITQPEKGVIWKANFYKTSSKSSNPHYLTWSVVQSPKPQFHLPQYFGILKFK